MGARHSHNLLPPFLRLGRFLAEYTEKKENIDHLVMAVVTRHTCWTVQALSTRTLYTFSNKFLQLRLYMPTTGCKGPKKHYYRTVEQ